MRRLVAAAVFAAALGASAIGASATRAAETVDIPRGEGKLTGALYRPDGIGPFPSVVALHSCDGLLTGSGTVRERYADWGDHLARAGLAALFVDSFGSRGLANQCQVRERRVRSSRERPADAQAARRWLQSQSWVAKTRVSLIGWSSGGIATLWAVRPHAAPHDGAPDFRSAVAFYPGCRRLGDVAWSARVPTLIFVGGRDDWSPAPACEQMVADARGRSAQALIINYPDAYHEFDERDRAIEELSGLAYTGSGSGKAHVGTDLAAREDAFRRVPEWLTR